MGLISVEHTYSLRNATPFKRYLGDSPANITVYVSKLSGASAIIFKTCIGTFGQFLKLWPRSVRFAHELAALKLPVIVHVERMIGRESLYQEAETSARQQVWHCPSDT